MHALTKQADQTSEADGVFDESQVLSGGTQIANGSVHMLNHSSCAAMCKARRVNFRVTVTEFEACYTSCMDKHIPLCKKANNV